MAHETEPWWEKEGYLAGRPLEGDLWLVVAPMIYTYRVMVCSRIYAGMEFYCYQELHLAMLCFDKWEGKGENPVEGWTKHHFGGHTPKVVIR
jgi:hypothetical protein